MPNEPAKAKTKVIKNVAPLRGMSLSQIIMNNGWSKYIPNEASPTRRRNPLVLYVACEQKIHRFGGGFLYHNHNNQSYCFLRPKFPAKSQAS